MVWSQIPTQTNREFFRRELGNLIEDQGKWRLFHSRHRHHSGCASSQFFRLYKLLGAMPAFVLRSVWQMHPRSLELLEKCHFPHGKRMIVRRNIIGSSFMRYIR